MAATSLSFLTLPFELRLQIYEIVLDKRIAFRPEFYLSISVVCRQTRAEVLPIVLRETQSLRSLSHLSKWASQGSPELLRHVQSISLHVFMESLSSITRCRPTSPTVVTWEQPHTSDWWEAKYAEKFEDPEPLILQPLSFMKAVRSKLSRAFRRHAKPKKQSSAIASTWDALTSIGELRKIWILLSDRTAAECPEYDIEQQLVLDMVVAACPKIQEFTGFSNLLPLAHLRNFTDLRLLRFSGYSKSTPEETLDVLRSLESLDSIIICRYPEFYDRDQGIVTSKLPRSLSLTPEVLSKIRPLKRFEVSHMTSRVPSEHVTIPILKALRAHRYSLRNLSITSDLPVSKSYLKELLDLIACFDLSNLYLQLTIPKTLQSFLETELIFPKNTWGHEMKISESSLSTGGLSLVGVRVRAPPSPT